MLFHGDSKEGDCFFVRDEVDHVGGAGGADALVQEEGDPGAYDSHIENVEENGGHNGADDGYGHERVGSYGSGVSASAEDSGAPECDGFGEGYDSHEEHDNSAHGKCIGSGGIEGEDFR